MADSRALFSTLVDRLVRRARRDLCIRRSIAGLFFGLLPGAVASLVSGSVALPIPALSLAVGMAAAGGAAGLVSALFHRVDRRRLLISADRSLGSRELASTAFELAESADPGVFTSAVLEDAAQLLARTPPGAILGRLRLPLAPFAVLAALAAAAGLLFPFDLRALFLRRAAHESEIARIGEDLRSRGLQLAEEARANDLGRSLALSQQLAQLGGDLAADRIQLEDALDRMSELESGLAEEYQLRMREAQGERGRGGGASGRTGESGRGSSTGRESLDDGGRESALGGAESALGGALDKLREAQRRLGRGNGDGQGDGAQAQAPSRPRGRAAPPGSQPGSQGLPPATGDSDQSAQGPDSGGAGAGADNPGRSGESGGSGIGTLPAPVKRGAPSAIIGNTAGPGLQARGNPSEGDSTRLLARALPQWTGSRLSEETIINGYSRQAESALARDEIPLKLKEYVKEYFTVIGISK